MPSQAVLREAYGLAVSSLIELWCVNGNCIGLDTIFYFCNGTNTNFQPVTYGGIQYVPFPIQVTEFDVDGKSSLPRPRLTLSNINGFVSSLLLQNNQLVGALITRTRVFARFLDASNWTIQPNWVTPDPTAHYEPETFYVNRKLAENNQIVSFELASVLDVQNVKLPRRQILANTCAWRYRDAASCTYFDYPVADANNKQFYDVNGYNLNPSGYPISVYFNRGKFDISTTYYVGEYVYIFSSLPQFSTIRMYYVCTVAGTVGITPQGNPSNWIADSCSKTCAGCKLRFPLTPLRTSAFPGVARAPFIARA